MAITSFLNIFKVTPYMIVSEQDSETSLNRRKPRPPADAASIWIRFVDRNVSGALDGAGTPYTGISPPAVLTGCPLCLRRLVTRQATSTLGLRLDNRISPICGSSPPSQPRLVCARKAAPPIPPFSSWDHGLLNPARLSFRAHIGCIQCTYSIFKLSPARTDAPLPIHSCRMVIVSKCVSN